MRTQPKTLSLAAALFTALVLLAAPRAQAAQTPRVAHTATLLPAGDILLAGGIGLNTTELRLASKGTSYVNGPLMAAIRSSHTATMMANGCVLIAGGWTGAGARTDADVYDPATNTIVANVTNLTARYNHTATSLNNGKVLLCGGQNDGAGTIIKTCDLFTPTGTTGNSCGGSFAATGALQLERAFHTAVLLKDGTVWFAGGLASGGYTPTTERYDPAAGSFNSPPALASARAYHTATVMGDGKVLIAGGYNAQEYLGNAGILDTLEIYDPVANTIGSFGPKLAVRREMHSATLAADGTVMLFGGLGNIPTTYINLGAPLDSGSLTDTWASPSSMGDITGAAATVTAAFTLDVPVAGTIHDGYVMFSTPSASFASGVAFFTPGIDATNGLRSNLAGVQVTDGKINASLTLSPMRGKVSFTAMNVTLNGDPTGSLFFGTTLGDGSNGSSASEVLTDGSIDVLVSVGMSPELAAATVLAGTITISGGSITQMSSYTATLSGGSIGVPAGTAIDGAGNLTFTATARNLTGMIAYTGNGNGQSFTSPLTVPQAGSRAVAAISGTMRYVATGVNLAGASFAVDVATVVIRSMVFGQAEFYNPKANQATFTPPNGTMAANPGIETFGHTATVLPNTDVFISGGYDCVPGCASFAPKNNAGTRVDLSILPSVKNFTATAGRMTTPRAFHTSTLLPDNTILVAGGTNGPDILASAEIFDPATGNFSPTDGALKDARNLHTATLLPNGRVLIAGGFTITGSTPSAELYYPDRRLFVPTSPMNTPRNNHTATLMKDGNTIVVGGFGPGGVITGTTEIYYSTSAAWKPLATTDPRSLHTATLLKDGRLMVAGGINSGGVIKSVFMYDPASGAWSPDDDLPVALRSHSATLLFDGRVLVAGGNDRFGEVNASYIYDPTAIAGSRWTATAASPLGEPRFGHTATLLPDGSVMISGGSTRFGTIPLSIEVYRVDASSWVPTGGPFAQGARAFHTMTLAANGKVYAIGGSDGVIGGAGATMWGLGEQGYFTSDADSYSKGAPPSLRRSTVTVASATPFLPGTNMTVNGQGFRGRSEASGGGSGAANSSFNFPHLILQRTDGSGFTVDLTSTIFQNAANLTTLDTLLSVALPPSASLLPTGWYNVRVGANGVYSNGVFVQAGPAKPPTAPTGLSGTTIGTSSISWTWSALSGVDGYNVYRASDGVFIATTSAPSFIETGLPANAACAVLVAGYTITGDGPSAPSSTLFTLVSPEVTSVIGSADSTTSIQWSWVDPGNTLNFEIWNSTSGELLKTQTQSTFADTGLGVNTPRAIRVRTITSNGPGVLCPSATVYTLAAVPGPIIPPLSGLTTGSFTLNWAKNGNPDGTDYIVNTYLSSDLSVAITTASTTSQRVSIGDLKTGTSYSSFIRALNGDGIASAPLPAISTYTLSNPPLNLKTLGTTSASIQVAWDTNSNPRSTIYQVTYSSDDFITTITTAVAFSSAFTGSTITISGLLTSVSYSIRTQARNPFGQETQFSNTVTTTTYNGGAAPGALAGLLSSLTNSAITGSISAGPSWRSVDLHSPAGAFPSDVTLTISSYDATTPLTSPLCGVDVNIALDLEVVPLLQPLKPIRLTVSYDPTELNTIPIERLALMRYDPVSRTCVPLSTTFNTSAKTFTVSLNHFSLYQLAQVPVATRADSARVFPNPYRTASDGYVTIDKTPPFSRVRVMTLRGETVFDQQADARGIIIWTPTNGAGRTVASGLYLIAVESESGGTKTKKILKLAVVR